MLSLLPRLPNNLHESKIEFEYLNNTLNSVPPHIYIYIYVS